MRAACGHGRSGRDRQHRHRHGCFVWHRCGHGAPAPQGRRTPRSGGPPRRSPGAIERRARRRPRRADRRHDPTAVRRLAETTLDRHGRIDGLVNNAGVSLHSPLDRLDLDEFARVLQLNVISLVAMTQAVLPAMRARRSGRIVNISSGTTRMALPGVGAYAATKSAVNMLTAVARRELEADGIAVSLVQPSITATEFGGGRYQPGEQPQPGMVAHSTEYVGKVVLRALRTGEERIDIPHGPEQPELTEIPDLSLIHISEPTRLGMIS